MTTAIGNSASRRKPAKRRGMWVVLLGPDGVGKSTVIEAIGDGVAAGFAGCDSFHLRPALLGSGRSTQTVTDPQGKAPRGVVVTVAKLIGLLAMNWIAYLVVVRRSVAKGRLVVFDRYFVDALVDPRRYRIPSSCGWLVGLAAGVIPHPHSYVVLDAPADVLLARKQEVPAHESERQRREYRRLMKVLPHCMVVNASRSMETVLDEVLGSIVERRLGRSFTASKAA